MTDVKKGLLTKQVEKLTLEGKVNVSVGKQSKTIGQIIAGNVFTYFNLIFAVFAVLLRMLSVRGGMYPVRCRPAAAARLVRVGRGAVSAFPAGAFAVRPFYHHGGLAGRRGLLWGACRVAGYPAGAVQPRLFAVCGRQLLFVGAVCFAAAHVYPVG